MIQARLRSPLWRMTRAPALAGAGDVMRHASMRLTAGFAYVGPPLKKLVARTQEDPRWAVIAVGDARRTLPGGGGSAVSMAAAP